MMTSSNPWADLPMSKPSPYATEVRHINFQTHRFPFTPSYKCTPQKVPSTADKNPLLSKQTQPTGRRRPHRITHKYPDYTQSTNTSSHIGPLIHRQTHSTHNERKHSNSLTHQLTVDAPTHMHPQTRVSNTLQPRICPVSSHV